MRKILIFLCFLLFVSCEKETNGFLSLEGTYLVQEQTIDSIECPFINTNVPLVITMKDDDLFKTSGYFNTTGVIIDDNIYINKIYDYVENNYGYYILKIVEFSNIKFNDDTLEFCYVYSIRTPHENYIERKSSIIAYKQ